MKVLREQAFQDVTIILESQEEVDSVYALFNHSKIVEAVPVLAEAYKKLQDHKSCGYNVFHESLSKIVGKCSA